MDAPQGLAYLRFESDIALEEERSVIILLVLVGYRKI